MRLKIHWSLNLRIWFRSWLTQSIKIKSSLPSRKKLLRSWRLGWALTTNLVWIDRDLTSNHHVRVKCPYQEEGKTIYCKGWIWCRSEASLTFSWMRSRLNWARTDSAKIHWNRFNNIKNSLLTKCQGILKMILSNLSSLSKTTTTLHHLIVSIHHLQINKIHWCKIMKVNLSSRMTLWANLNKTRLVSQNSHCFYCHMIQEATNPNY